MKNLLLIKDEKSVRENIETSSDNQTIFFQDSNIENILINASHSCNIYLLLNNTSAKTKININLIKEGISVQVSYVVLTKQQTKVDIDSEVVHSAKSSSCNLKFIGFALEESNLKIRAKNFILKGMKQSSTHQMLKIVTEENAMALAEPGLMIDEFDVVASHGNSIGQIDRRSIYYLQSRGIEQRIAKWLVIKATVESALSYLPTEVMNVFVKNLEESLKG